MRLLINLVELICSLGPLRVSGSMLRIVEISVSAWLQYFPGLVIFHSMSRCTVCFYAVCFADQLLRGQASRSCGCGVAPSTGLQILCMMWSFTCGDKMSLMHAWVILLAESAVCAEVSICCVWFRSQNGGICLGESSVSLMLGLFMGLAEFRVQGLGFRV